jgi:peptidyl-dipeptidase A
MKNPSRREFVKGSINTALTCQVLNQSRSGIAQNMTAADIILDHENRIRPIEIANNKAWWNANVSGKDEDFTAKEKAQNTLDAALADKARFARIKAVRDAGVADKSQKRQIELLYLQALEKQVSPEILARITARANSIEKAFNVYRAKVNGAELTDSQVRETLKNSKSSAERKAVWESSKGVGAAVEKDLKELVALRNEAAKALGFSDFHVMMLSLNEQKQADVVTLFDELDGLTRKPYMELKAEIDTALAKQSGVSVGELRPWHYQDPFFQEAPSIYPTDLDAPYKNADITKLCKDFYTGIGLPVDAVIARSDLFEKAGKSPHAFCTDIDREGDVRVLANIVGNEYWMGTMLHELGHAVYSSRYIPQSVPYLLRGEAHILTTEGVAMLFEQFSKDADWLGKMGVPVADAMGYDAAGSAARRARLLIFSRWCQVMLRFEKAMYADPGQDLNRLWWDLVENYQGLKRPEGRNAPDYASKIHVVSAPAYYHNYMMGQLFASQVHHAICRDVLGGVEPGRGSYVGNKNVGQFMIDKVFTPGRSLPWNELTRYATGELLSAKAFAADFKS